MSQELSARVQQVLERVGEDEALTDGLTDPAAAALLEWITQQVQAADTEADEAAFRQRVAAIRSAARSAAEAVADDPAATTLVVERAQAALQATTPGAPTPLQAAPAPAAPPQLPADAAPPPQPPAQSSQQRAQPMKQRTIWSSLRRRVRRWAQRKV